MEQKTLKALKASIAKWEKNATAEYPNDIEMGVPSCPLCTLFHSKGCEGCPVSGRTGHAGCGGTPYTLAMDAHDRWDTYPHNPANRDSFRIAVQCEVDFLKSLLPETE